MTTAKKWADPASRCGTITDYPVVPYRLVPHVVTLSPEEREGYARLGCDSPTMTVWRREKAGEG